MSRARGYESIGFEGLTKDRFVGAAPSSGGGRKPFQKPSSVTEESDRAAEIESLKEELAALKESFEFIKKNGMKVILPTVQRSVSIPVTPDQGGTGVTSIAALALLLGSSGTTVTISTGNYLYFGDSATDGSWRMYQSGDNLVVERRESAVWVEKSAFLA